MEKIETGIPGCFIVKPKIFSDNRGDFIKLFNNTLFEKIGLPNEFKEIYYSTSGKGVIRGLHFQTPPEEHLKCIICLKGELFDAVVDIRKESPTYGQNFTITLKSNEPTMLIIPEGLAHGFMALTDDCLFLNKSTTGYCPVSDGGIKWDTCGIQWPELKPIVSEKDSQLEALKDFNSPF